MRGDECYGIKKQGEEMGSRRIGQFAELNRMIRIGLTEKVRILAKWLSGARAF